MDFNPTEAQCLLADTVAGLVRDHYDFEKRRAVLASGKGYSPAFWKQLAELGLLGVEIDEAHGGSGGRFEDAATILQPLGRALVIDPVVPAIVLGAGLISRLGGENLKRRFLPEIAAGRLKFALAHDGDGPPSRATRESGGWRLAGAKTMVFGGALADWFVVSARADNKTALFIVAAGDIAASPYPLYDGSLAADIRFNVLLKDEALLCADGAAGLAQALDRGAAAVINEAVGAMDALCDLTLDYLKQRHQFGKPIGSFQVLQHRMVDMRIALEQARSMAMLASVAADYEDSDARAKAVSAAKYIVGQAARTIGQSAVQLHGGIAMTDEYSAGHYFKRLTMIGRVFGDTSFHLARYSRLTA